MTATKPLTLFLTLWLAACGVRAGNPDIPNSKAIAFGGMSGRVTAADSEGHAGEPIEGVRVRVGNTETKTNAQGLWRIDKLSLTKDAALAVAFDHPKFTTDIIRIPAARAAGRYIETVLRPFDAFQWIEAATGGELSVPAADGGEGLVVKLPPFTLTTGQTAAVGVSAIRPEVKKEWSRFPGELIGFAADLPRGNDLLRSFGMVAVEIRDENGEIVSPAFSSEPQLKMRIDQSIASDYQAGRKIRTWSLDNQGVWQGEGEATVSEDAGTLYANWTVPHFSVWNLDAPLETHACVALALTPKDEATRKLLNELEFVISGVDYAYTSPAAVFKNGVAAATGWRAKDARLTLRPIGTRGEPFVLSGEAIPAQVTLPDREGSTKWGDPKFDPRTACLLIERTVFVQLGRVTGTVLDDVGNPVPGAVVALPTLGRSEQTDAAGRFLLDGVPWDADGSISMPIQVLPPWGRPDLQYAVNTLKRTAAEQDVTIVALPSVRAPRFVTVSLDSSRAVTGSSVPIRIELADDGAALHLGLSVCGKTAFTKYQSELADSRVTLCHVPQGAAEKELSIKIAAEAVDAHLAHGDYKGVCKSASPETPPDFTTFPPNTPYTAAETCGGSVELQSQSVTVTGKETLVTVSGVWNAGSQAGNQSLRLVVKDDLGYQSYDGLLFEVRDLIRASALSRTSGVPGDGVIMSFAAPIDPLASLVAGDWHQCALTVAGAVKCWGYNEFGQIGNGATVDTNKPVPVTALGTGNKEIAAAFSHTCAVTSAGGIKCWGANNVGQLGDGTTVPSLSPVNVSGMLSGVKSVASKYIHSCALTTGGAVKCWGYNNSGRLGNGNETDSPNPVDVTGLSAGIAAIDVGEAQSCAVTTAGGVKCWGTFGTVGDGSNLDRLTPVDVVGLTSGVSAIAAGAYHTCALTTGGAVKCWGWNSGGTLGDGMDQDSTTPVNVSGLSGVVSIAAGGYHTCALMNSGSLNCWGSNWYGELGYTGADALVPAAVPGLTANVVQVAAGENFTCAKLATGVVKCWGYNANGMLGDGTFQDSDVPVDSFAPGAVWFNNSRAKVVGWSPNSVAFEVPAVAAGDYSVLAEVWGLLTQAYSFTVNP